jgi:nitrite reductase (NADH) small subunit
VNLLAETFMSDFVSVAKVGDIPDGEARTFPVNGRMVAVFNSDGELHAINDTCPHMGASLATGHVEDGAVTCPWHAWRYCIKTGTWLDNPNPKLATDCYQLRVEGDDVQVLVPDPPPRPVTPAEND